MIIKNLSNLMNLYYHLNIGKGERFDKNKYEKLFKSSLDLNMIKNFYRIYLPNYKSKIRNTL